MRWSEADVLPQRASTGRDHAVRNARRTMMPFLMRPARHLAAPEQGAATSDEYRSANREQVGDGALLYLAGRRD